MNKAMIVSVLFLLVFVNSVFAAFTIDVMPETVNVLTGGSAEVDINISTDLADRFSISVSGWQPWMTLSEYTPFIEREKIVKLYLTPFKTTSPGLMTLSINVQNSKDVTVSKEIKVKIEKGENIYIDSIVVKGDLKPETTANIEAKITNYGSKIIYDVFVQGKVSKDAQTVHNFEQRIDSIGVEQSVFVSSNFSLTHETEPGFYTVKVDAYREGSLVSSRTKLFEIPRTKKIDVRTEEEFVLFGSRKVITLTNLGNVVAENVEHQEPITDTEKKFYIGEGVVEGNVVKWVVDEIKPGESVTLVFETSYLGLLVWILLASVLAHLLYKKIRQVRVRKYVMQRKTMKTGELFKIILEVRNFTMKKVRSVVLRDFVPPVFAAFEGEGLKPIIKKSERGTELIWRLRNLERGEHRILQYSIKPVLGITGKITLPKARITFELDKKTVENFSNRPRIGL